jgi:hypothetical protein
VPAAERRDLAGLLPQPREPAGLRARLAGSGHGVTRGGHRHSHERQIPARWKLSSGRPLSFRRER